MKRGFICFFLLFGIAFLAASCGGGESGNFETGSDASFSLSIPKGFEASFGDSPDLRLVQRNLEGGEVELSLIASGTDIRGAFVRVSFDTDAFHLVESGTGAVLVGFDPVFLAVSIDEGVDAGVMIAHPDTSAGFNGDGEILWLRVAPGADTEKSLSKAPTGPDNRITFETANWEESGDLTILFHSRNIGDYNLDGDVTIADVADVARHYLEEKDLDGNFPEEIDEVIDGTMDGAITIADVAPIASNYLVSLKGYLVQYSAEVGTGFSPSTIPVGSDLNRLYSDVSTQNPWPEFSFTLTADFLLGFSGFARGNTELMIRVIPHDGTELGIPGKAFHPTGGIEPPPDTAPPVWDNPPGGVTAVAPVADTDALDVTFDSATDAESPPVEYVVWYGDSATFNIGDLTGTAAQQVFTGAGTERISGLQWSTEYTVLVRARDSAVTPNETNNTNTMNETVVDEPAITSFLFTDITKNFAEPLEIGETGNIESTGVREGGAILTFEWETTPAGGSFANQSDSDTGSTVDFSSPDEATYEVTVTAFIDSVFKDSISVFVEVSGGTRIVFNPDVMSTLMSANCTSCHSGGSPSGGLNLEGEAAYDNMVWVDSQYNSSYMRVKPGEIDLSMLYLVAIDHVDAPDEPGHGFFPLDFLWTVEQWIKMGAWRDVDTPAPPPPG